LGLSFLGLRNAFPASGKAAYIGAMTPPSTGPVAAEIATRLTATLAPTHLEVVNDSAHHHGHAGDDGTGESHFTVIIESAAFTGASRIERQRMVNKALGNLLSERIHALSIRARAPGDG
jgi:BolA protein